MRLRLLVVALALLPAGLALAAPPAPLTREAVNARVDAIQALPLPTPLAGEVRVGKASEERRLKRGFLEQQEAQPDWRDIGIVVAAGRHRLESIAAGLGRADLLECRDGRCKLSAPLAVETGATLIVDGLAVELEQKSGTALVVFGDLFVTLSTIQGSAGGAPATTDGTAFRPFVVAYDASRTVIRDSRLLALGYDGAGTTGLAATTTRRDDPPARPELRLATSLIENLWDGVLLRGTAEAEVLRTAISGARRHGIAVRDGAQRLLVADNEITGSGAVTGNGNGVLVSRDVAMGSVVGNTINGSAGSGILVDKGSRDLTIAGNEIGRSGRDALVVYESTGVDVLRNTITNSGRSAIRVRASDAVRIGQNGLIDNARAGIDLHDWSGAARPPNEEEAALVRPTSVTVTGNRFTRNTRGNCVVQGTVAVLPAGASDCS